MMHLNHQEFGWIQLSRDRAQGCLAKHVEQFRCIHGTQRYATTQPIRIGRWDGDPSPSIGWVDHLGFWSTVLSEGEIEQLLQRQTEAIGCTDASACYNTESSRDDVS